MHHHASVVHQLPDVVAVALDVGRIDAQFRRHSHIGKAEYAARKAERTDIEAIYVPANDIANELGNTKVANMVMLGAYIQAMGNLSFETIKEMLVHMFTGPKAKLVDLNIEALRRGAACVK